MTEYKSSPPSSTVKIPTISSKAGTQSTDVGLTDLRNGAGNSRLSESLRGYKDDYTYIDWLGSSYAGADIKVVVHMYKVQDSDSKIINDDITNIESEIAGRRTLINRYQSGPTDPTYHPDVVRLEQEISHLEEYILNQQQALEDHVETVTLATLQTLSVQSHREKYPVRAMGQSYVKGYCRGQRCLPATEKVLVKDRGYISVADVLPGDLVQSTAKTYNKVLGSFAQRYKECVKLTFENGYTLSASCDHPVLTPSGWTKANELIVGDKVLSVGYTPVPEEDNDIPDYLLKLIALLTGDGGLHRYPKANNSIEHRITLSIKNEEMLTIGEETSNILKSLEIPFTDVQKKGCIDRRISVCTGTGKTSWKLRKYNSLHEALLRYGLYDKYSHQKFVPNDFLANLSRRQIILYLQYLFSTDGGYSISKDLKYIEASYCSTSEELIDGVRLLLSKLGIHCLKNKSAEVGKVGGRPSIISKHDAYKLVISDSFNLYKFVSLVGIFGKDERIRPYQDLILSRSLAILTEEPKEFIAEVKKASKRQGFPTKQLGIKFNLYQKNRPLSIKRALSIARVLNDSELNYWVHSHIADLLTSLPPEYQEIKVVKKEQVGKLAVYDLEVEDRHQFICNFIAVHNTIAGSMIFTTFSEHALAVLLRSMDHAKYYGETILDTELSSLIPDQLPPIDCTIVFANEYGSVSRMGIYGLEFVNDGITFSIEDLLSESVMQFVARDIDIMTAVGRRKLSQLDKGYMLNKQEVSGSSLLISGRDQYLAYLNKVGIQRKYRGR